jgi:Flp pilus assembly protein TadG
MMFLRKLNQHLVKTPPRGQSLIELAVSILVLLILLAGILDLGRAFFQYLALHDAAQEGAVYAAINNRKNPTTIPQYCSEIQNRVLANLYDPSGVIVNVLINGVTCASSTAGDFCSGHDVRVTVTDPDFPIVTPFIGAIIGAQSIPLSADSADGILRPVCP